MHMSDSIHQSLHEMEPHHENRLVLAKGFDSDYKTDLTEIQRSKPKYGKEIKRKRRPLAIMNEP